MNYLYHAVQDCFLAKAVIEIKNTSSFDFGEIKLHHIEIIKDTLYTKPIQQIRANDSFRRDDNTVNIVHMYLVEIETDNIRYFFCACTETPELHKSNLRRLGIYNTKKHTKETISYFLMDDTMHQSIISPLGFLAKNRFGMREIIIA